MINALVSGKLIKDPQPNLKLMPNPGKEQTMNTENQLIITSRELANLTETPHKFIKNRADEMLAMESIYPAKKEYRNSSGKAKRELYLSETEANIVLGHEWFSPAARKNVANTFEIWRMNESEYPATA